jgi:hypothetical protein
MNELNKLIIFFIDLITPLKDLLADETSRKEQKEILKEEISHLRYQLNSYLDDMEKRLK